METTSILHIINDINDPYSVLIVDDPVRPEIPLEDRVSSNAEMFVMLNDNKPQAMTCVSYRNLVPTGVDELFGTEPATIAVFYTIWSYAPGAGKKLLNAVKNHIKNSNIDIQRFVTLSPQTDMAKKFHIGNGAILLQVNNDTVNYEYLNICNMRKTNDI